VGRRRHRQRIGREAPAASTRCHSLCSANMTGFNATNAHQPLHRTTKKSDYFDAPDSFETIMPSCGGLAVWFQQVLRSPFQLSARIRLAAGIAAGRRCVSQLAHERNPAACLPPRNAFHSAGWGRQQLRHGSPVIAAGVADMPRPRSATIRLGGNHPAPAAPAGRSLAILPLIGAVVDQLHQFRQLRRLEGQFGKDRHLAGMMMGRRCRPVTQLATPLASAQPPRRLPKYSAMGAAHRVSTRAS